MASTAPFSQTMPPAPGPSSPFRKFYKHHMQRLQTSSNHVLFYVCDAHMNATLAIVVSARSHMELVI